MAPFAGNELGSDPVFRKPLDILLDDHRIRAGGQGRSGEDAHRLPRPHLSLEAMAGSRLADHGKLGVNAELNLINASGPDSEQYRAVLAAYAPEIPLGSFSQMGFLEAKIAVSALQSITGELTKESVNAAFKAVENFETDILCKPWYYGDGELHIPNNTDRTVVPQDGVMVLKEECFPISDLDPAIARVREIEAAG